MMVFVTRPALTVLLLLTNSMMADNQAGMDGDTAFVDKDSPYPGAMRFVPPKLTEEEQSSKQMPYAYRCSGCMAVAYQFQLAFAAAEKKLKKATQMPLSSVLEITEDVCNTKFTSYGLKGSGGRKFLTGDGLPGQQDPGMMEGGGKWESRLRILCLEIIGHWEEEGIYAQYQGRNGLNLNETLCTHLCTSPSASSYKEEL